MNSSQQERDTLLLGVFFTKANVHHLNISAANFFQFYLAEYGWGILRTATLLALDIRYCKF